MMSMAERRRRCRELIDRYYSRVPTREEALDGAISDLLRPTDVLLDAGCGSTLPLLRRYAPKVALALGVDDVPPAPGLRGTAHVVLENLEQLPLGSESVDLLVSRSVVEHLDRPTETFTELARVLRPGGHVVFTTPNKYYYSCLIALLTPEAVKSRYFSAVFGEDAYDYFPVRYRANTRRAFARLARLTGLEIEGVQAIPHYPFYLMFSPMLFRLGIAYDKLVEALGLESLQSTWLVVMRKPC